VSDSGSFTYANPPVIHWGPASLTRIDGELRRHGAQRPFVVTTRSVASSTPLMERLRSALGGRDACGEARIGQHAPASDVAAAVAEVQRSRPDVLISIGGGSPIDAAKSIAFAVATGLDMLDPQASARARGFEPRADQLLPHVAVPTTLSAAELSGLAGFTTEDEREKVGLRSEALIPSAVIYDAEVTLDTPLDLWLSTGIRAVDHAVETILSRGNHPYADTLALESLRRMSSSLRATCADPADRTVRTESQLGAWFSFTLPLPAASGLSHTLGKRIGSRHAIPHGVCSCLLLPHVMRYLVPREAAKLARIAAALGIDVREMPAERAALCAADAVSALIADLGLPRHLSAYGLGDEDLEAAARPVASADFPFEDLVGIYRAAL
jgi:alcohol dehydrogenase